MAEQPKNEIQIELTPEVATDNYSTLAVIAHSAGEIYLDFIPVAPNMPKAKVVSRIIMNPENAKNLMFALTDNIKKYEATFGEITRKQPKNGGTPNPGNIPNPFIMGGNA